MHKKHPNFYYLFFNPKKLKISKMLHRDKIKWVHSKFWNLSKKRKNKCWQIYLSQFDPLAYCSRCCFCCSLIFCSTFQCSQSSPWLPLPLLPLISSATQKKDNPEHRATHQTWKKPEEIFREFQTQRQERKTERESSWTIPLSATFFLGAFLYFFWFFWWCIATTNSTSSFTN